MDATVGTLHEDPNGQLWWETKYTDADAKDAKTWGERFVEWALMAQKDRSILPEKQKRTISENRTGSGGSLGRNLMMKRRTTATEQKAMEENADLLPPERQIVANWLFKSEDVAMKYGESFFVPEVNLETGELVKPVTNTLARSLMWIRYDGVDRVYQGRCPHNNGDLCRGDLTDIEDMLGKKKIPPPSSPPCVHLPGGTSTPGSLPTIQGGNSSSGSGTSSSSSSSSGANSNSSSSASSPYESCLSSVAAGPAASSTSTSLLPSPSVVSSTAGGVDTYNNSGAAAGAFEVSNVSGAAPPRARKKKKLTRQHANTEPEDSSTTNLDRKMSDDAADESFVNMLKEAGGVPKQASPVREAGPMVSAGGFLGGAQELLQGVDTANVEGENYNTSGSGSAVTAQQASATSSTSSTAHNTLPLFMDRAPSVNDILPAPTPAADPSSSSSTSSSAGTVASRYHDALEAEQEVAQLPQTEESSSSAKNALSPSSSAPPPPANLLAAPIELFPQQQNPQEGGGGLVTTPAGTTTTGTAPIFGAAGGGPTFGAVQGSSSSSSSSSPSRPPLLFGSTIDPRRRLSGGGGAATVVDPIILDPALQSLSRCSVANSSQNNQIFLNQDAGSSNRSRSTPKAGSSVSSSKEVNTNNTGSLETTPDGAARSRDGSPRARRMSDLMDQSCLANNPRAGGGTGVEPLFGEDPATGEQDNIVAGVDTVACDDALDPLNDRQKFLPMTPTPKSKWESSILEVMPQLPAKDFPDANGDYHAHNARKNRLSCGSNASNSVSDQFQTAERDKNKKRERSLEAEENLRRHVMTSGGSGSAEKKKPESKLTGGMGGSSSSTLPVQLHGPAAGGSATASSSGTSGSNMITPPPSAARDRHSTQGGSRSRTNSGLSLSGNNKGLLRDQVDQLHANITHQTSTTSSSSSEYNNNYHAASPMEPKTLRMQPSIPGSSSNAQLGKALFAVPETGTAEEGMEVVNTGAAGLEDLRGQNASVSSGRCVEEQHKHGVNSSILPSRSSSSDEPDDHDVRAFNVGGMRAELAVVAEEAGLQAGSTKHHAKGAGASKFSDEQLISAATISTSAGSNPSAFEVSLSSSKAGVVVQEQQERVIPDMVAIRCPMHHWRFRVSDGRKVSTKGELENNVPDGHRLKRWEHKFVDGKLWVKLGKRISTEKKAEEMSTTADEGEITVDQVNVKNKGATATGTSILQNGAPQAVNLQNNPQSHVFSTPLCGTESNYSTPQLESALSTDPAAVGTVAVCSGQQAQVGGTPDPAKPRKKKNTLGRYHSAD
ncbi:unnamed protein product [Amoebophrya sp. A120]|nr:unnamed protein product [Amoebophrya sp. A120]|eukprot:GSA120T00022865001.1